MQHGVSIDGSVEFGAVAHAHHMRGDVAGRKRFMQCLGGCTVRRVIAMQDRARTGFAGGVDQSLRGFLRASSIDQRRGEAGVGLPRNQHRQRKAKRVARPDHRHQADEFVAVELVERE